MTFKYNDVYVEETATIVGPYEKRGPLSKYFDKAYEDFYFGEESFEKAEVKLIEDSIETLLTKIKKKKEDINVLIAGDLLNQIAASNYAALKHKIPFLGIYSACATSVEGIIIASSMIDAKKINNAIAATSSHNLSSEKQFRQPVEYGAPKPNTASFTATGAGSILLSNSKTNIKIESSTIGEVTDLNQNDPNNMGAAMVPAAAHTINKHLKDLNREVGYYDLILTGDLGAIGKEILIDHIRNEYALDLTKNYDDCGNLLYDRENQENVLAGGGGPGTSAIVTYGYIIKMMKEKKYKKVLLVATGALFSPTLLFQKENILSIAHAVSLEVVE